MSKKSKVLDKEVADVLQEVVIAEGVCPSCGIVSVDKHHHKGSALMQPCDFFYCSACGSSWISN